MAVSEGYLSFVLEQFKPHAVTHRRMFGGAGLYFDGVFFGLIAEDELYLKVDPTTQPDFEAAGSHPFKPWGDERAMRYFSVPPEVLEDRDRLTEWTLRAVATARRTGAPARGRTGGGGSR